MTEGIAPGNTWGGIDVSEGRGEEQQDGGDVVITEADLLTWSVASLMGAGADQRPAEVMARILLSADKRGHYSHGFNRLDIYHSDIVSGICQPNTEPVIERETPGAALVDGRDGLGGVVAEFSMELAIKKAREVGVGWVTAKNSNHFGIAGEFTETVIGSVCVTVSLCTPGHYSMMAERAGMLGLSFTNGSPWVTATRSAGARVMSTNPISFTAPGTLGDSLVLDMATATVAVGKLEVAAVNNQEIPAG